MSNSNIPPRWKSAKLGEVCLVVTDGTHKTPKYIDNGVPFISIANIRPFSPITFEKYKKFISKEEHKELSKRARAEKDDILFPRIGTLGYAKRIDWDYEVSIFVGLGLAKPNKNVILPGFLEYYMNTQEVNKFSINNANGSGRLTLPLESSRIMPVPLPPLPEQHFIVSKIEELFSELDKSVNDLKTAKQQLKTYRQSVLNTIVTNKNIKLIEEVIEKLDQGWSPRCLNESSKDDNEWAVIKTSAVQHGNFVHFENKILPNNLKPREQHELKIGDILITRAGPRIRVGVCCMVRKIRPRLINCDKVYRIKVNTKIIKPEYFELILNTPYYQRIIEKMKSGISDSGLNLTQTKFTKIEIPIPSLKEQQLIIDELESSLSLSDKLEESINEGLHQAETLRQSILKMAFEGRLVLEKEVPAYKPKNVFFYQMQVLGLIAKASKEKEIQHGEMTIAKYTYLLDKIYGVPTYYEFDRLHLGPYPPGMKKAINNKQFFNIQEHSIDVKNEKTLFKYANPYKEQINKAVYELTDMFSKYQGKVRSHKTELLATVCKVIEDIQTMDIQAIRQSLKNWKIKLSTSPFKNKADKFSEEETKKCLQFICGKGWHKKLLKQK